MSAPEAARPGRKRVNKKAAATPEAPPDGEAGHHGDDFVELATSIRPEKVFEESMAFFQEMFRIASGTSELAPNDRDRRFQDPAWTQHPFYRQWAQAYLAWSNALENLADSPEDWRIRERVRFGTDMLTSMMAPTNTLPGNPEALKRAFETGGASILAGMQHYFEDLHSNRGMPLQVDRSQFRVGENMAATPGQVVFRNELLELIQYSAQTDEVVTRPLLVIPPQIGRYYYLDMGPGRSMAEYALREGLQLFVISWRNPTAEQADWGLDRYVSAVLEATDAVRAICATDDLNTMGFCAGGITMTAMLGYLAAIGDRRVHAAAYAVTLLDYDTESTVGALRSRSLLEVAKKQSASKGIISGEELGMLFTWMRPNDLVWSYWVNNYLMGRKPPGFDILAWNADSTNLPAALHADFLDIFQHNSLRNRGAVRVLGKPVDLSRIDIDNFVTGAESDHITPWQGCYRTTQLLGGDSTFVLSSSGHIASLVNPPGNPKSYYLHGADPGADPQAWVKKATKQPGSWWEHWSRWLKARSGPMKTAPAAPGSAEYPAIVPAPGSYVHG